MTAIDPLAEGKEQYSFVYGDEAVPYTVVRQPFPAGKKRKITIKVHPNCEVVNIAPDDAGPDEIHRAVMKRAKWICDSLKTFRDHLEYVQEKNYVSGEVQFYLGRRYMLKVLEDADAGIAVKLRRGQLQVTLNHCTEQNKAAIVKRLVRNWYQRRAETIFKQRLLALSTQATWLEKEPGFRVLPMAKQWGSCSAQGNLMLNPHLVKAPKECIDYVILHELCHIEEHNHSERFWRLMSRVMPHWKAVKSRLDSMAELYLNE